jgi:hypothetical protein
MSSRALQDRHATGYRLVREALESPRPKPRKQYPPRRSRLDPFTAAIDAMLDAEATGLAPRLTIQTILDKLTNKHAQPTSPTA